MKRKETQGAGRGGRVFSFGLFVADMIYSQKPQDALPDEFLGIKRARGDNAIVPVSFEWIAQAKEALEARGVSIETNFGGLSNATVSILAALTPEAKITLIAPCGNDEAGRANVVYLERLGVDTHVLRESMRTNGVSACNLIRNLGSRKDYAVYLTPAEGFCYSKWMPRDLKHQDIVHIGGVDITIYPEGPPKEQKQEKYKKNIDEMVRIARIARQNGAIVVADFCIQDPGFWEIVPESFFKDVDVVKPGIAQALPIYNSRHKSDPIKLDVSQPQRLMKEYRQELLKIQDFLLKLGFGAVFMTLDAGGTIICAREGSIFGEVSARCVPVIPARIFVDGTGCGDAFVAGIIYGIREGLDMFATACFASAIGSLIAERVGVMLEEQYIGKGKWLPVVQERLKQGEGNFNGGDSLRCPQ